MRVASCLVAAHGDNAVRAFRIPLLALQQLQIEARRTVVRKSLEHVEHDVPRFVAPLRAECLYRHTEPAAEPTPIFAHVGLEPDELVDRHRFRLSPKTKFAQLATQQ